MLRANMKRTHARKSIKEFLYIVSSKPVLVQVRDPLCLYTINPFAKNSPKRMVWYARTGDQTVWKKNGSRIVRQNVMPGSKCATSAGCWASFDCKMANQNTPWRFERDLASIVATMAISANNKKPIKASTQRFLLWTTKIHKSSTTDTRAREL